MKDWRPNRKSDKWKAPIFSAIIMADEAGRPGNHGRAPAQLNTPQPTAKGGMPHGNIRGKQS